MRIRLTSPSPLAKLIVSMCIFGTIGIFRRFIPLSSELLAFCRGLLGALFICIYARRKRIYAKPLSMFQKISFILSGAAIGINWMLLFEAFNYTSVAVATLCYYMQPTIVLLLSALLLGERMTIKKGICALIAVIGMILLSGVSGPNMGPENHRGVLFGLSAAFLYAIVILLNKKTPPADAYSKTAIQLFSAAIIMVPYLFATGGFSRIEFHWFSLALTAVVGLVHTGIAYALFFSSLDGLKAQTVAIFSYIDPVTALVLSVLVLHEPLTVRSLLGAIMILGAAAVSEIQPKCSR